MGKHPLTPHGLKDATSDLGRLGRWWRRWPQANIGLVTGEVADVLDIDGPAGRAAVRRFTADHDLRLEDHWFGLEAAGTSTWPQPAAATGPTCWSTWTGVAAAATLSPHLLDMPAAAATGGCGHSPPNSPQHRRRCAASSTSPEPTQLSRFPRRRSARLLVAILTAAPR